jgi:hypothetical protein
LKAPEKRERRKKKEKAARSVPSAAFLAGFNSLRNLQKA